MNYHRSNNVEIRIARIFNTYGPRMDPLDGRVLSNFVVQALNSHSAGGIGVLHKNMSIDRQAAEVDRVKRSESGMILKPITLRPGDTVREATALMHRFRKESSVIMQRNLLERIINAALRRTPTLLSFAKLDSRGLIRLD